MSSSNLGMPRMHAYAHLDHSLAAQGLAVNYYCVLYSVAEKNGGGA